jgi:hypothetical protein
MYEEIKHDQRTFLRTTAMSIAAASLGRIGSVVQATAAAPNRSWGHETRCA